MADTPDSILFCTPCYGGLCTAAYLGSCIKLERELNRVGLEHDWDIGTNESLITRARNEMTASFLKSDHSHLFWIDADIEFEPKDVAALWNMEVDIACGVYCMKKRDKQWYAAWKDGQLVKELDQFKEPIEVDYCGTGFLLIRRNVIEKLVETAEIYQGPDGLVSALFMTPIHNDGFESEDYHFCRKSREAGFKIIMDPSVRLGHWGQYRYGSA